MSQPRWKGKSAEQQALNNPMSKIVSLLQTSLIESDSHGILSGSRVLLPAQLEQVEILNRACFGCPIKSSDKHSQWFQLSLEEAFYLCKIMKCIKIVVGDKKCPINDVELWHYMVSKNAAFPVLFKAYSHLRLKNWVVRAGSQYGVDFVVYRHHPALVHSEYAAIALCEEYGNSRGRLKVWSDFHCTLRLCGSVAKTLLVLYIDKCGNNDDSPSCLENYLVEERTITRWNPEQSREDWQGEQKSSTSKKLEDKLGSRKESENQHCLSKSSINSFNGNSERTIFFTLRQSVSDSCPSSSGAFPSGSFQGQW